MDASIVISSMNGGGLLECLLFDIKSQDLRGLDVEVLLLEAGTRDEQLETQKLGEQSHAIASTTGQVSQERQPLIFCSMKLNQI